MKRHFIAALGLATCIGIGLVACNDNSPTSPSDTVKLTAQLSPANEVPPVTNAESSGSGTVTITMHLTRNGAGTITAATADFQVSMTGFPVNTPLTMAHIHTGSVGVSGAVLVNTGLSSGEVTLSTGAGAFAKTGVSLSAATAQDILANPANFYFNVHTALNPSGVARGQLVAS
jgi:hypothetical protein